MKKEKAGPGLQFIKNISREIGPDHRDFKNTLDRIKDDVLAGLRVGFFIQEKPFVASLNKETKKIELNPLDIEFEDEN